jgi:molybdopterin converting factor subunit 1
MEAGMFRDSAVLQRHFLWLLLAGLFAQQLPLMMFDDKTTNDPFWIVIATGCVVSGAARVYGAPSSEPHFPLARGNWTIIARSSSRCWRFSTGRSMRVNIRLFAVLRERAGQAELVLDLPPEATVADAAKVLVERLPALQLLAARTAYAVNQSYVTASTVLSEGDELALIPPVSGG